HCNDWMTSLIPLYLKTTYKKDPVFKDAKSVFTVYNNEFLDKFEGNLVDKAKMLDIDDQMLTSLKSADFSGFVKLGMEYADTVVRSDEDFSDNLNGLFKEYATHSRLSQVAGDENLLSSYQALYNELAN
ncbi:MAG: glycogen synthase, partial [Hymenobacter sp.]